MAYSLAYRKHEEDIQAGRPPAKYMRLLPHIPRGRILEVGSAEGVLALLLARRGDKVTAVEKSEVRHEAALRLYMNWLAKERNFAPPEFVNGSIADNLGLLANKDVLVAIRSIYYLDAGLETVFTAAAKHIPNVVLCGNRNRAARWRAGTPDEPLGDFNRYAAREGMIELLTRHGYQIIDECREGDEIVVGRR